MTDTKGIPKRDGSGKGTRANKGRGGCSPSKQRGGRGMEGGAGVEGGRGNRNKN